MYGIRLIFCVWLIFVAVDLQAIKRVGDEKPTNGLESYSHQTAISNDTKNFEENETATDNNISTATNTALSSARTSAPYMTTKISGSNQANINKILLQEITNHSKTENGLVNTTTIKYGNTTNEENETHMKVNNSSEINGRKGEENSEDDILEDIDKLLKKIFSSDDTSFIIEEQDEQPEANSESPGSNDNKQNQVNDKSNARNVSVQFQINTNSGNNSQELGDVTDVDKELHSGVTEEDEGPPFTTIESKIDMVDENYNHSTAIDGVLSNLATSKPSSKEVSSGISTDSGQYVIKKRIDVKLSNDTNTEKNANEDKGKESSSKSSITVEKATIKSIGLVGTSTSINEASESTSNFTNKDQIGNEEPQLLTTVGINQSNVSGTNSDFRLLQKSTSDMKATTEAFNKATSSFPKNPLSKRNETS